MQIQHVNVVSTVEVTPEIEIMDLTEYVNQILGFSGCEVNLENLAEILKIIGQVFNKGVFNANPEFVSQNTGSIDVVDMLDLIYRKGKDVTPEEQKLITEIFELLIDDFKLGKLVYDARNDILGIRFANIPASELETKLKEAYELGKNYESLIEKTWMELIKERLMALISNAVVGTK